jgi:hypothetical protein
MAEREAELRRELRLPTTLIERVHNPKAKKRRTLVRAATSKRGRRA